MSVPINRAIVLLELAADILSTEAWQEGESGKWANKPQNEGLDAMANQISVMVSTLRNG